MEQSSKQCFDHLCTTTAAAPATTTMTTTTRRIFQIYLSAIHDITRTFTHIQKKLLVEGDSHIEAVRKGRKYFTNSTSYRNIRLLCVKLFKLQNKFCKKYKLYLLSFLNNLISVRVPYLMIIFHERFSK